MIPRIIVLRPIVARQVFRQAWRAPRRLQSSASSPASKTTSTVHTTKAAVPTEQTIAQQAKQITQATGRSSIWHRLGPVTRGFQAYGKVQRKRPYLVQTLSMVVVFTIGDIVAQYTGGEEYDPIRTARNALVGGVAAIPQYKWFVFLGGHFNFASRQLSMAVKVLAGQAVFSPIFSTYFFGMQSLLTGGTLKQTYERLLETVPRSWLNSWKVWPPVTYVAFMYVPLEFRSVFTGVVAIGWQTYLSYLNKVAGEKIAREAALRSGVEVMAKPQAQQAQMAV